MTWDRVDRIIFRTMKRLQLEKKKPEKDEAVEEAIDRVAEKKHDTNSVINEMLEDEG